MVGPTCFGRKARLSKYNRIFVFKTGYLPWEAIRVQDIGHFRVCESCFRKRISMHENFSSCFEELRSPDHALEADQIPESRVSCNFYLPIIRKIFYTKCVPQGSLKPLLEAAGQLGDLPRCLGNTIRSGGELYTSTAIPDISICVRCFEEFLKSTCFEPHFTKQLRGDGCRWICDIGKIPGYTHVALISALGMSLPHFPSFAKDLNVALRLTDCPGQEKAIPAGADGQVHVYGHRDITICQRCFYDTLKYTEYERHFVPMMFNPQTYIKFCSLATPLSKLTMERAFQTSKLSIWFKVYKP